MARSTARSPSPARRSPSPAATRRKSEYGNHMAQEGEISHIPTFICVMYLVLALYAALVSFITGASLYTIPLYYCSGMLTFYLWHRMAHSKWTGVMWQLHMQHHQQNFPPHRFYGTEEQFREMYPKGKPKLWNLMDLRETTTNDLRHEGPLYVFMAIILAVGRFVCHTSYSALLGALLLYAVMGVVGNAFHMSFHIRNFHLEKYTWYLELRALHYNHHRGDMKSNLAMVNMGMDGLFKSLALSDPQPLRKSGRNASDGPAGIPTAILRRSASNAGFGALVLGFDVPLLERKPANAVSRGYPTIGIRIALCLLFLHLWWLTEDYVGQTIPANTVPVSNLRDVGQDATAWLAPALGAWVPALCTASSLLSELTVAVFFGMSILGSSFRPVLSIAITFILRLAMRYATTLPYAEGAQWVTLPWMPTFFIIPEAANVFFSGRVALATVLAVELQHARRQLGSAASLLGAAVVGGNAALSLALSVAWTAELMVAILFALYACRAAALLAPWVDAFMP